MNETLLGGSIPIPIIIPNYSAARRLRAAFSAVLAAAAALVIAGCHSKSALTSQQSEGKQLYDVRCAHCHENNDLAMKPAPPDLHGVFKQSTLPSGAPATDEQVARTVLQGKGTMPSFAGRFTTAQMEALLSYLHTTPFAQESRP